MTDILIRPAELRQTSEQLRAGAKKIGAALQAIDQEILSLKGDKFMGNRANAVQAHYAPKREALLKAKELVAHFAEDLLEAATRFEQSDKPEYAYTSEPGGDAEKLPLDTRMENLEKLWGSLSEEQRLVFLQKIVDRLAQKYGFDTVPVALGEIPYSGQYVHNPLSKELWTGDLGHIVLYSVGGDLNGELRTLLHETRHAMQDYFLRHPDEAPASISEEQIDAWKKSQDEWNDMPDKIDHLSPEEKLEYGEKGLNLAHEVDARKFAEEQIKEIFFEENFEYYFEGKGVW